MQEVEQQTDVQAAELLMEHGAKVSGLITFRPQSAQAAAEAVGQALGRSARCCTRFTGTRAQRRRHAVWRPTSRLVGDDPERR